MKFIKELFSGFGEFVIAVPVLGIFLPIILFLLQILGSYLHSLDNVLKLLSAIPGMLLFLFSGLFFGVPLMIVFGAVYVVYGIYCLLVGMFNQKKAKYELLQSVGFILGGIIIIIGLTISHFIIWNSEIIFEFIGWPYL